MKKLVVVLGMHRSGTSVLTRGLQVVGVNLGHNLMAAGENNQKGFWEDLDINELNIEMLAAINNDWNKLKPVGPDDIELLRKNNFIQRAADLLHAKIGDNKNFGFKDPRVTVLLPFWKEVFITSGFSVQYIFAIRNPVSVARSLAKRNHYYAQKSYFLWLRYMLAGLRNIKDEKYLVVDYDRMIENPDREIKRIAGYLDLEVNNEELKYFKTVFIDEGLRHTTHGLADIQSAEECFELIHEIYPALLEIASDDEKFSDSNFKQRVTNWSLKFDALRPSVISTMIFLKKNYFRMLDFLHIQKGEYT